MKTIEDNPAKGLFELSELTGIKPTKLCEFTEAFVRLGWISKERERGHKLHFISKKGKVARVCLETLVYNKIPKSWAFEEVE